MYYVIITPKCHIAPFVHYFEEEDDALNYYWRSCSDERNASVAYVDKTGAILDYSNNVEI